MEIVATLPFSKTEPCECARIALRACTPILRTETSAAREHGLGQDIPGDFRERLIVKTLRSLQQMGRWVSQWPSECTTHTILRDFRWIWRPTTHATAKCRLPQSLVCWSSVVDVSSWRENPFLSLRMGVMVGTVRVAACENLSVVQHLHERIPYALRMPRYRYAQDICLR